MCGLVMNYLIVSCSSQFQVCVLFLEMLLLSSQGLGATGCACTCLQENKNIRSVKRCNAKNYASKVGM